MARIAQLIIVAFLGGTVGRGAFRKYRSFRLNKTIMNRSKGIFNLKIESDTDDDEGNGFMIEDGMILTNYHILRDIMDSGEEYKITLMDKDKNIYDGEKLRCDKKKDLCLVKIDDYDKRSHIFRPIDKQLGYGIDVMAIYVLDEEADETINVTYGKTNGMYYRNDEKYEVEMVNLYLHIPDGWSGTPLLDYKGKLLGINRGAYGPENMISEAISSREIIEFMEK